MAEKVIPVVLFIMACKVVLAVKLITGCITVSTLVVGIMEWQRFTGIVVERLFIYLKYL